MCTMYYVLCAATIVKYGGKGLNIYIRGVAQSGDWLSVCEPRSE